MIGKTEFKIGGWLAPENTVEAYTLAKECGINSMYLLGGYCGTAAEQKQIEVIHNRLSKNFSRLADFAAICALADLFYSLYGAFYAFLDKNYGWMSLVSVAAGLLLVGMTVKAVSELRESVQTKYMLQ